MSEESVQLAEIASREKELTLRLQSRERIWLAVIAALATLSTGLMNYATVRYSASEVKTTLTTQHEEESQDRAAIVAGVDASVKSWKAYDTKDPGDMGAATKAVADAEKLVPR